MNVFGLFAVALLGGSLANSLRSAGAQLEQASTEIADLQALNQHVIDSLPSGLATTDPALRILTFNRGAEAITGRFIVGARDPWSFADLRDRSVPARTVLRDPSRLAAVYHESTGEASPDYGTFVGRASFREIVVVNESMI